MRSARSILGLGVMLGVLVACGSSNDSDFLKEGHEVYPSFSDHQLKKLAVGICDVLASHNGHVSETGAAVTGELLRAGASGEATVALNHFIPIAVDYQCPEYGD